MPLIKWEARKASNMQEALDWIGKGQEEIVLVPIGSPKDWTQDPSFSLASSIPITSTLESNLLNIPEVIDFYNLVYGSDWGLRPIPIFSESSYTVLSKNISLVIGFHAKETFRFVASSTKNKALQNLLFKLKPNSSSNEKNHLIYYNRWNGSILDYPVTHTLEYNALQYLLIHAALLVKEHSLHCANICVDCFSHLKLLDLEIPMEKVKEEPRFVNIREFDFHSAQSNQCGLIDYNGHPNISLIRKTEQMTQDSSSSSLLLSRFADPLSRKLNAKVSIFSGTWNKPWPSFLFRRNWFSSLGNQREQGAWMAAISNWVLTSELQEFLWSSWIPDAYKNRTKLKPGIDLAAMDIRQEKFIQSNFYFAHTKWSNRENNTHVTPDVPSHTNLERLRRVSNGYCRQMEPTSTKIKPFKKNEEAKSKSKSSKKISKKSEGENQKVKELEEKLARLEQVVHLESNSIPKSSTEIGQHWLDHPCSVTTISMHRQENPNFVETLDIPEIYRSDSKLAAFKRLLTVMI